MDLQRDYPTFRKLMGRLCDTLGKPCSEELVESWWKALRHVALAQLEHRVDDFLMRATDGTKFPRPSQMRDAEDIPSKDDGKDYRRDFWRSLIVDGIPIDLGVTFMELEPIIVANKNSLGIDMQSLLNDCGAMDKDCVEIMRHRAAQIAIKYSHLGRDRCRAKDLRAKA